VQKLKKDLELITIQHETSEASLKKRYQETINDLTDQLEQLNRQRNKSLSSLHAFKNFVTSFLYFNGTGSVYVCIRKSTE